MRSTAAAVGFLALLAIAAHSGVPPEFAVKRTLYREHAKDDDGECAASVTPWIVSTPATLQRWAKETRATR
jgi:hypothetical protein